jgi:hypothetical protein
MSEKRGKQAGERGGVRKEERREEKEKKIQRKKTSAGRFAFSKKYYSLLGRARNKIGLNSASSQRRQSHGDVLQNCCKNPVNFAIDVLLKSIK